MQLFQGSAPRSTAKAPDRFRTPTFSIYRTPVMLWKRMDFASVFIFCVLNNWCPVLCPSRQPVSGLLLVVVCRSRSQLLIMDSFIASLIMLVSFLYGILLKLHFFSQWVWGKSFCYLENYFYPWLVWIENTWRLVTRVLPMVTEVMDLFRWFNPAFTDASNSSRVELSDGCLTARQPRSRRHPAAAKYSPTAVSLWHGLLSWHGTTHVVDRLCALPRRGRRGPSTCGCVLHFNLSLPCSRVTLGAVSLPCVTVCLRQLIPTTPPDNFIIISCLNALKLLS